MGSRRRVSRGFEAGDHNRAEPSGSPRGCGRQIEWPRPRGAPQPSAWALPLALAVEKVAHAADLIRSGYQRRQCIRARANTPTRPAALVGVRRKNCRRLCGRVRRVRTALATPAVSELYDFSLSICHRLMSHPVITSTLGSAPLVQQLRQELSRKRRRTHVTEMRNRLLGCNRLRHNGNAAGRSVSWICGGELAATGDLELAALC